MRRKRWDIFCTVVDNFGDIGLCWRLARQLAAEHGLQVRLWVDDLASFQVLCPELDPLRKTQTLRTVEIRHWAEPFTSAAFDGDDAGADVVIEAFACNLPQEYLAAMARRARHPLWLNLEYLSAENWVESCHRRASPQPGLPLTKHFFFPGFTAKTGGLLREKNLLHDRATWQTDPAAAWPKLGLPAPQAAERSVSLFCYDNTALPELLDAWSAAETPLRCLIAQGATLAQAAAFFGRTSLTAGDTLQRGNLSVIALPFLSQENYDRLLWTCDLNFVRGEDSFVRAQWAAKPFVWQIYPQDDGAHLTKLEAFLDRYCAELQPPAAAACRSFWQTWNQAGESGIGGTWADFRQLLPELSAHARSWTEHLGEREDLASNLVDYCKNLL